MCTYIYIYTIDYASSALSIPWMILQHQWYQHGHGSNASPSVVGWEAGIGINHLPRVQPLGPMEHHKK